MDWAWEMALERVAVSREASISRPALSRILGLTPAQPLLRDWDGAALGNTLASLGGGGEGRNMQSRAGCAIWLPRLGRGAEEDCSVSDRFARRQHCAVRADDARDGLQQRQAAGCAHAAGRADGWFGGCCGKTGEARAWPSVLLVRTTRSSTPSTSADCTTWGKRYIDVYFMRCPRSTWYRQCAALSGNHRIVCGSDRCTKRPPPCRAQAPLLPQRRGRFDIAHPQISRTCCSRSRSKGKKKGNGN